MVIREVIFVVPYHVHSSLCLKYVVRKKTILSDTIECAIIVDPAEQDGTVLRSGKCSVAVIRKWIQQADVKFQPVVLRSFSLEDPRENVRN